ncbi:MAG: hypothetical protein FWG20_03975 [Candidatus Cloacimonetes bacterium]|nr:hypothetical protein [Candidatus Cloacimonadota bacterium]
MPYLILFIILIVALVYFLIITKQEYNKLNKLKSKPIEDITDIESFEMNITGAEIKIGDTIIRPKKVTIKVEK